MSKSEPMHAVDRAWLRMDRPDNLMIITGILALDRPLDFDTICQRIDQRFKPFERFHQTIGSLEDPQWQTVNHFDIHNHVKSVKLPDPAGRKELETYVSSLLSEPLDPKLPLWKFDYIANFKSGSALVGRFHHCIGDGMALMKVILNLTDAKQQHVHRPAVKVNQKPNVKSVLSALKSLLKVAFLKRDPPTKFKGVLQTKKRVAWSESIPLSRLQALQKLYGVTLNDLLVTLVSAGLRERLLERGAKAVPPLRAVMPVNLRSPEKMNLGNKFGLVFLKLPTDSASIDEQLKMAHQRMDRLKRSPQAMVVYQLLRLCGRLSGKVQARATRLLGKKATLVMTNVPGPVEPLHFGEALVEDFMFWVPQSGDLGIGVSILSYAGKLRMGVASDVGLEPQPAAIIKASMRTLEQMEDAGQAN